MSKIKVNIQKSAPVWKDRKRNFLGLPWSFTEYSMTEDRLFIRKGFLNKTYDEVRLYRVRDTSLTRSLFQRITHTGTIHLTTSDMSLGNFDLKNITDSEKVNELLSNLVDEARKKNRVFAREDMSVTEHECDETGEVPEELQ
ncbi:MAG: PH domain-containing protein [Stomatobaculum sp.]|nr:PH domain-containing protein [Stomatobaculum sp.]